MRSLKSPARPLLQKAVTSFLLLVEQQGLTGPATAGTQKLRGEPLEVEYTVEDLSCLQATVISLLCVFCQAFGQLLTTLMHVPGLPETQKNLEPQEKQRAVAQQLAVKRDAGGHAIALPLQLQELRGITIHTPGEKLRMEKI